MKLEHVLGDINAEGRDSHRRSPPVDRSPACSVGGRAVHPISWRKEFGGLKSDQVKRLKDLEKENERLRKAVSDLTLEKLILKEAASGNY